MEKKKKTVLALIEWIIFALIAFMAVTVVNKAFLPKYTYQNSSYPTTSTFEGLYGMKPDTVDVLFLGSSVAVNAFDPQQLYNEFGIRSYNLASEGQSVFFSYYWLKEALRFQKPRAVILELYFLGPMKNKGSLNMDETKIRKCMDPMKWSPVKAEAVRNIAFESAEYAKAHPEDTFLPAQSQMSYYLTNIRFHTRWMKGLGDVDLDKRLYASAPLKGWSTLLFYVPPEITEFKPFVHSGSDERAEVLELQKEYLRKIGQLCKEEDIQLILVNLPGCGLQPQGMTDGFVNTCSDLAEEIGADYYNYGEKETYDQIGIESPKEWPKSHSNYWGSVKLTRYTGKLLSETYRIPPAEDEQYEVTKAFFDQVVKDANLQYIDDIDEYLEAVNDPQYTLFFSICGEGTADLRETTVQKLRDLGIRTDLAGKEGCSWYAVVDPKNGVCEELSENETLTKKGVFGRELSDYKITSAGQATGAPKSSIAVNGTDYAVNSKGINIVVWDNVGRALIDSVTFDTSDGCLPYRTWFSEMLSRGEEVAFARW